MIKDEYEIALTLHANAISTIGHTEVLKKVKKVKNERELEAVFIEKSIANGAREQAYHSIVASGTAAATLHYQKNDAALEGKLNLLLDAGAEFGCYASDIVFPPSSSSSFLKSYKQILIYMTSDTYIPHLRQLQQRKSLNLQHRSRNANRMHKYA